MTHTIKVNGKEYTQVSTKKVNELQAKGYTVEVLYDDEPISEYDYNSIENKYALK